MLSPAHPALWGASPYPVQCRRDGDKVTAAWSPDPRACCRSSAHRRALPPAAPGPWRLLWWSSRPADGPVKKQQKLKYIFWSSTQHQFICVYKRWPSPPWCQQLVCEDLLWTLDLSFFRGVDSFSSKGPSPDAHSAYHPFYSKHPVRPEDSVHMLYMHLSKPVTFCFTGHRL